MRIARRLFLPQILGGDGAVQLHDRVAGLDRVARLLQEVDYPSFGGGGEDGKSLRYGLAMAQPRDLVGERAFFSRLDANADVGLLVALLVRRLTTVATTEQAEQEEEVCPVSVERRGQD